MTTLTLEEFQSLCHSHKDETLEVEDIQESIEVHSNNKSGKGMLYLNLGIAEAIRGTNWHENIPEWARGEA